MRIISWNVLFRPYELKYNPSSLILNNDESYRTKHIIAKLLENITNNTTAICLQEASSEFITMLRNNINHSIYDIFTYQIETNEYLVTIAIKGYNLYNTFKHPTSRGYLVIRNHHTTIVNCHLKPQYCCKENIMDYLTCFYTTNKDVYIIGDYNEKYKNVKNSMYNTLFTVPFFGKTYKQRSIDHIVFYSVLYNNYKTDIIEKNTLSDHNGIILDLYY